MIFGILVIFSYICIMIYNRNVYEGEFLKKEDFIRGLGFNTSILTKLNKKRTAEFDFYNKDSIAIDGSIRIKKFHPLLNKIIIDSRDGQKVIIESVHKHWYNGYYWCIVYRTLGTRSHGTLYYKNENSIDSTIIEAVEETINNWKFMNCDLQWKQF